MIRIAVVGAGGVGAYFGGILADHYKDSRHIQIFFICKEATSRQIKEQGLKLETTHGNYNINPHLYSINKNESLVFDYIICCTKSFDLESSLVSLKNIVGNQTVIIPLLNGIDNFDNIKKILPSTEVWEACVYIVSRLVAPAHVKETGGLQLMYFGSHHKKSDRLISFEKIMAEAGLKAICSDNIKEIIWEKFLFISSIATMTSYLNVSIGEILSVEKNYILFHELLLELIRVGESEKIEFVKNVEESVILKMKKLPFEASSSMHNDFKKGAKTELETLTGIVVRMARERNVKVPIYEMMYQSLKMKNV